MYGNERVRIESLEEDFGDHGKEEKCVLSKTINLNKKTNITLFHHLEAVLLDVSSVGQSLLSTTPSLQLN